VVTRVAEAPTVIVCDALSGSVPDR
jgi:hypothetical protein